MMGVVGLVALAVADHGVDDVYSSAGCAGQRGCVGLAFGPFAVVGPAGRVLEAGERGGKGRLGAPGSRGGRGARP